MCGVRRMRKRKRSLDFRIKYQLLQFNSNVNSIRMKRIFCDMINGSSCISKLELDTQGGREVDARNLHLHFC